ncbi:hypothetical protein OCU04_002955 [Sclerotinia nivalis]|uniref:Uncharacterized protein n=1 Tax=Sclerotinia nivalis TaxID=352851 RepID=A0A9X0AV67_9HELO|nr:hypothetical protein OCU04_002955 [Sclerotinia nivalis]
MACLVAYETMTNAGKYILGSIFINRLDFDTESIDHISTFITSSCQSNGHRSICDQYLPRRHHPFLHLIWRIPEARVKIGRTCCLITPSNSSICGIPYEPLASLSIRKN